MEKNWDVEKLSNTENFSPKGKKSIRRWWHLASQVIFCLFYLHGIWLPTLPHTHSCWASPLSSEELDGRGEIVTPTWHQTAGAFNSCRTRRWIFLGSYIILRTMHRIFLTVDKNKTHTCISQGLCKETSWASLKFKHLLYLVPLPSNSVGEMGERRVLAQCLIKQHFNEC